MNGRYSDTTPPNEWMESSRRRISGYDMFRYDPDADERTSRGQAHNMTEPESKRDTDARELWRLDI